MLVVGGLNPPLAARAPKPGRSGRRRTRTPGVVGRGPAAHLHRPGRGPGRGQGPPVGDHHLQHRRTDHRRALSSDGQAVSKGRVLVELKGDGRRRRRLGPGPGSAQADREYTRWKTSGFEGHRARASADRVSGRPHSRAPPWRRQRPEADKVIRAPFFGRVGISGHRPGRLISPGTAIVTLDDVSLIRVDFSVPDRYLPILREGPTITRQAWTPLLGENVHRPYRPDRHPHRSRHRVRSRPGPSSSNAGEHASARAC